jgi:DNA-binding CsgD family transcriptional regulator
LGLSLSLPAGRRLAQLSGGNPYYALELARAERDQPVRVSEESDDLPDLVERRLSSLPVATRTALGILAAAVHPRADQVAQLVGDDEVLDSALAAGVLEHDGHDLRFAHPLLAAAAYRTLPPRRRRSVHERLGGAATDPIERARHLAAASVRSDGGVASSIEQGARTAAARGAPTIAADLFEQAARLTPQSSSGRAAGRRLEAARQLFAAGDGRRALERCRDLLNELPPGELRADLLTTMAWRGKVPVDSAIAMCEQAAAECTTDEGRARCLLLLSNVMQTHDAERARERASEALALLGDGGDLSLRSWALGMLGASQAFTDPAGPGIGHLREASLLEREHGSSAPDVYLEARTQLGLVLMWRDELEEARKLLSAQHARATGAGQEAGASTVALHLAELEIRAGDLDSARAWAHGALAVEDEGQDSQTLGAALYVRAHVAALEGDVGLADKLARRGLAVGRAVHDGIFPLHNRWVLGQLALALGDVPGAVQHLQPLPAESQALGFLEPGSTPFISDCVDALIAAGRLDEAQEINTEWEEAGRRLSRPRLLATGARSRGTLEAARGNRKGALAILQEALQHHDLLPVPHERARTLLLLGATLRRAGHRRDARAVLAEATAVFQSLGQPLWVQRTNDEIARLAGPRPAGGELTPAEWQVAQLVADGRSNREVADALFITIRTVEANLTRIYRKLELRSRSELAARWQDLSAALITKSD